jgi:uncharacterized membrane protein
LLDDLPETYANRLAGLQRSESEKLEKVISLSLQLANGRINHNHALNKTKAWSLNGAFWSMPVELFVEMGAIAYIAFAIRPS